MDRRIDAHIARTQFGQIMDLATKNNERFIVDRRGEPAVVIMSVQDFIRTAAPPPDWLAESLERRQRRGSTPWRPPISTPKLRAPAQDGSCHSRRGEVIRAVIDTNVLVSGLLSPAGNEALILLAFCIKGCSALLLGGHPRGIRGRARTAKICVSAGRDRRGACHVPQPRGVSAGRFSAASSDPTDTKFLHCAQAAQADYLVTGNKRDFPQHPMADRV